MNRVITMDHYGFRYCEGGGQSHFYHICNTNMGVGCLCRNSLVLTTIYPKGIVVPENDICIKCVKYLSKRLKELQNKANKIRFKKIPNGYVAIDHSRDDESDRESITSNVSQENFFSLTQPIHINPPLIMNKPIVKKTEPLKQCKKCNKDIKILNENTSFNCKRCRGYYHTLPCLEQELDDALRLFTLKWELSNNICPICIVNNIHDSPFTSANRPTLLSGLTEAEVDLYEIQANKIVDSYLK